MSNLPDLEPMFTFEHMNTFAAYVHIELLFWNGFLKPFISVIEVLQSTKLFQDGTLAISLFHTTE